MDPGMLAFVIIVCILIAGLIASVIVLFLIKPNKTNNGTQGTQGRKGPQGFQGRGAQGSPGPIGPQSARGFQGFFGFQGLSGPQGSSQGATGPQGINGPQGIPGTNGTSNALADRRFFTFTTVPGEDAAYFAGGALTANFLGAFTRINNLITIAFENVECFVINPSNANFFIRITLPFSLNNFAAYTGFVFTNNATGTDAVPIILQDITVLSGSTSIRLRFLKTNNTAIWSGAGSFPPMRCFFSVTYLT